MFCTLARPPLPPDQCPLYCGVGPRRANLKAELSPQLPPERPTKSGTPRGSGGDAKNRQPAPAPAAGADDDGVAISSSADALARGLPGSCTKSLDGSEWRATHSQSPLFESGTSNAVDEQLGPPRGLGHTRAESIEKLLNYRWAATNTHSRSNTHAVHESTTQ